MGRSIGPAGQAFHNASPFTLRTFLDRPGQLKADFAAYLDGHSDNVQDIVGKLGYSVQLDRPAASLVARCS